MVVAWFCNHSSWFVLQNEDTAVFVTLNAPIRQYEDETFLLIWIQHLFWFYHLLVQTEAWWLFVVFICSMLFLSVYWNYFNNMSVLQVTTVFATKLKSFTFVPLLKRLPVENRVWKKVLQTGRPNKVSNTLEMARYGSCKCMPYCITQKRGNEHDTTRNWLIIYFVQLQMLFFLENDCFEEF